MATQLICVIFRVRNCFECGFYYAKHNAGHYAKYNAKFYTSQFIKYSLNAHGILTEQSVSAQ